MPTPEEARQALIRWHGDPVALSREVFGVHAWSRQAEMMRAAVAHDRIAVRSGHKVSKALHIDTPIPTSSGWTTMGEIREGEEVYDERGQTCHVTHVFDVMRDRPCFAVEFSDGADVTCDADHEWLVSGLSGPVLLTTQQLHDAPMGRYTVHNHAMPQGQPQGPKARTVVAVWPVDSVPVRCISVDSPSRLYLCSRASIPTHNSTTAVCLALWFYLTRPRARVVLTAPTYRQIRSILWKELRRVYMEARVNIGGTFHENPEAGLQADDGREILGFSTKEPERMAGISGPNVLFLCDESSGIPENIFQALEGNRAGGAKLIMFSNPTQTSGTFFDAFGAKREFWHTIHISSTESPNVTGLEPEVPGLATKAWIEEKKLEWGVESPLYQVRVLGQFPNESDQKVISMGLVHNAIARWEEMQPDGSLHIGVDVARFGSDESVMVARRGYKVIAIKSKAKLDGPDLAGEVVRFTLDHLTTHERAKIKVDEIGVGASVIDSLRRHECRRHFELTPINVAAKATAEGFLNLRSQLWFSTRNWLREGGAIPDHGKLIAELLAPEYHFDAQGRQVVETKEITKQKIGRSPDYADALANSIYDKGGMGLIKPSKSPKQSYRFTGHTRGY